FDLRPSTFDLRPSTFDLRPSTFDLRPPTFDLRPPTSHPVPYSPDARPHRPRAACVASRGETHDGHALIPQADATGAAGVVTERDVEVPEGVEVVRVESTLDSLIEQATAKVRRLGPDVVAITGSMGKTSTRTAVHAVLA